MPGPPPKPKAPDDLAEVERALSVLQGRNPEFERARREDEAARSKRRAEIDAASAVEASKTRKRRLVIGAIVVVAGTVIVFAGSVFRSEVARRGSIEQATDSYRSMGFTVIETSGRGSPGTLDATPEKGCFVTVASNADAPLKVTRPSGPAIEGKGPVVFCTCSAEKVTVTSSKVEQGGGLALLRIDGAAIGGSRAFAYLPFKPGTTARSDDGCADAELDAWIDGKRFPANATAATDPDNKLVKADPKKLAALESAGYKTIATMGSDQPFIIVDLPKESCLLGLSKESGDKLTLRMKGGATPIANAPAAFAYCASGEGSAVLMREGTSDVALLAAPVARVGGTVGLGEVLDQGGIAIEDPSKNIVVPPADRAWNARALLVASAVPEGLITMASAPTIPADTLSRVDAVSFGTSNALVTETAEDVFSFCEPPLGGKGSDALCVFSGAHAWKISNAEAVGGVARAKLPFWLFALEGVNEPAAMKAATELVTFARRMRREGYEPTTIEAMTEQPNGVEVLGRMGEDAVVALGVAPSEPWIFPYGEPAWTLTSGKPAVVNIKVLEKVKITTTVRNLPSKDTRRSVVFRHQKKG